MSALDPDRDEARERARRHLEAPRPHARTSSSPRPNGAREGASALARAAAAAVGRLGPKGLAAAGYETEFDGTDQTFLVAEAPSLGLSCEQIAVDADALRTALEAGKVVICNVGPGDFTEGGHFFVITGLDDEGRLAINDPYSAERSDRAWDVDQVISQTMGLYAYSAA